MRSFRDIAIAIVAFIGGVTFGAAFRPSLPGRESRLEQQNKWLDEQLQKANEEIADLKRKSAK